MYDDDDDDWCFKATFVHMVGNETKSKIKQPSDMPRRDSNTGGSDLWSNTLPLDPKHMYETYCSAFGELPLS